MSSCNPTGNGKSAQLLLWSLRRKVLRRQCTILSVWLVYTKLRVVQVKVSATWKRVFIAVRFLRDTRSYHPGVESIIAVFAL